MNLSFEKFKDVLEKWGKHLEVCFHAKTSGMYSYDPARFAEAFWESLDSESADIDDLFDRVIAGLQAKDFNQAYSSPEELLDSDFVRAYDCNMNPYEALKLVNEYAWQLIIKEGILDKAFITFEQALELQVQRRGDSKLRKRRPGFVYFIKADSGATKIGRTSNLDNRMKAFAVSLPFPIRVEHVFETIDMINVERKFHELFADRRLNGEWFDIAEDVLLSIRTGEYNYLIKETEMEIIQSF
jgi:hypothetical protein